MQKPTLNPDVLADHYGLSTPATSEDFTPDQFSRRPTETLKVSDRSREPHSSHESIKRKAAKLMLGIVATGAVILVTTRVSEALGNQEQNPWQQPAVPAHVQP